MSPVSESIFGAQPLHARVVLVDVPVHREQDAMRLFLRKVALVAREPALVVNAAVLDAEHAHVTFAVEGNVAWRERILRIGAGTVEGALEIGRDLAVDLDVAHVGFHAEEARAAGAQAHIETGTRGWRGRRRRRRGPLRAGHGVLGVCGHHGCGACACGRAERDTHEVASANGRLGGWPMACGRRLFAAAHL
jgi:hypothetical protein